MDMAATQARPFTKWAGGKTQLLHELRKRVPDPSSFVRYYEPFIGGGALFFDLRPERATLSDSNDALIDTYCAIRNDPGAVIACLQEYREKHSEAFYYQQRDEFNAKQGASFVRAARFVYLNKACFNGIFRVNRSKGEFNVPWGKRKEFVLDEANIRACSAALTNVKIIHCDFEVAAEHMRSGDFAYFDPPYVPVSASANFTAYAKEPFGPKEQTRLHNCALDLKDRGVHVLLSNSDTPLVRQLYNEKNFTIERVEARRNINRDGGARGPVGEVLIR
jgi:DNA adenine methylase